MELSRSDLYAYAEIPTKVSKKALDIDGLGPKIIDVLLEHNLIGSYDDLFRLKKGDVLNLPRFAETSVDNLLLAIEKSKKVELPKFLISLSIDQVGEETAFDIAERFRTLPALASASVEELQSINGVGDVVAHSLVSWFKDAVHKKLVARLVRVVDILPMKKKVAALPLENRIFVLTGTMPTISRNSAKQKIRAAGGTVSGSVSVKTDFVVAGENPGSKLDEAKRLGVAIIDEKTFLEMLA